MLKKTTIVALVVAASSAYAVATFAHGGATGVVKERMDLMGSLAKSMKSLSSMMRGKETYDPSKVRSIAKEMASHGGEAMTKLFPEGTTEKPSEALPQIWKDWERFKTLSEQMAGYANALEKAAGNSRAMPGSGGGPGMGGGMMGPGQGGMMGGNSNMMMGGTAMGPSPEQLAQMPPDASFMRLTQTCVACHQDFRKEKK